MDPQEDTRTSLDRHPTHHPHPRDRVTSLHPFPSMASADAAEAMNDTIAARRARARTSSQAPSRLRLHEYPRRHLTVSSRPGRVPIAPSLGVRSAAEDSVAFSLAGTRNSSIPQSYVDPGYSDLNPEYGTANSRPVWGVAGPLPRMLRPAMVPTIAEARERRHTTAPAQGRQPELQKVETSRSHTSDRFHRFRRSTHCREHNVADKEPVDVEHGNIPIRRLRQASVAVNELRAGREEQLLSRYALQRIASRRSQRSTTASSQDRFHSLEHTISPLTPYLEIDEDRAGLGQSQALNATADNASEGPSVQVKGHSEPFVVTDEELTDVEDIHHGDDAEPSIPLPAYDDVDVEVLNNHNTWSVIRSKFREELAEFLAVVVQLTFGFCADLSTTFSGNTSGLTAPLAWGFATMQAIYIAGGISGAHLNPAITIVLAIFRGFPLRKVPGFILAQILGSFVAAFIAYGLYQPAIVAYANSNTPTTATIEGANIVNAFITSLRQPYVNWSTGFMTEFVATSFLVVAVLALGDNSNAPPGAGMNALIVGCIVVCQSLCFANNTGAALNPTRDLGPRLALLALGFDKRDLFVDRAWWWLYGPWAAVGAGALFGALVYDVCIFTGGESPVNWSKANVDRVVKRVTAGSWGWRGREKVLAQTSEKEVVLESEV